MHELKESTLEAYLVKTVKERGGRAYKFSSPQRSGVPDRIVCWPAGRMSFVEVKAKGKKPTHLQELEHENLRGLGFQVYVLDSKESVDAFVESSRSMAELKRKNDMLEWVCQHNFDDGSTGILFSKYLNVLAALIEAQKPSIEAQKRRTVHFSKHLGNVGKPIVQETSSTYTYVDEKDPMYNFTIVSKTYTHED